jgi:ribonuclease HI
LASVLQQSLGECQRQSFSNPNFTRLRYVARLQFTNETENCKNKIAEYEVGLQKLRAMGVQSCIIKIDSKIIVAQIKKECIARDATLEK